MVKISGLRIRKGIYRFEARKRFQHVQRYRVVEKKPLEKIRDSLRGIFAPKKKEEEKRAEAAPSPGGFNIALMVGAVAIAILILLVGFLWWQVNVSQPVPAPFKPVEKSFISNRVIDGDVLTAGPRGTEDHVASVLVRYNTTSIQNYTITLTTYPDDLPTEIFVLNFEPKIEASQYSGFLYHLRKELGKKKITVNEISIDQLETVPKGAAIIVPTGVIPQELVEGKGNVSRLLDDEVVVIYIGQSFKSMLKGTFVTPTPQATLEKLPVSFTETSPTCSGISLFQPLYRVSAAKGLSSTAIYGCVSVVKKGTGALLFVPQTLDGGWKSDTETAAKDIAKIIVELKWVNPDDEAGTSYFTILDEEGTSSGTALLFSEPYEGTNRTVRIHFAGYSTTGTLLEDLKTVRLSKEQRGELFVSQLAVTSTNITSERIRMNAKLSEPSPSNPLMYIVFTDGSGEEAGREFQDNINTQTERNLDVPINLDQGEYKVTLEDDESRVYAATYLEVTSISITGPRLGGTPSTYIFSITTPITLRTLSVDVDNGAFTQEYSNVPQGELRIDVAGYTGGDSLSYGNHSFRFKAGGLTKTVFYNRPLPPPPFPPEMIIVALLAGGIMAVGIYFARQEKVLYLLDIPDFPPVSRTKIPLNSETVLTVFDKVNENYRWEFTPLTVSEVKNGFKDIFYKGKPIYISDYNTEFLLNELVRRKKVYDFLEYYGPLSWEKSSKHSVHYLGMLRKLRDICVNNAVPFTSLNESEVCDSEITVVGQQMFLHFYDKDRVAELVKSSLETIGKGITIMLFKDNSEKNEFATALNSTSGASLVLKVEVENSSVLLLTYPELETMVQEFKGV